LPEDIKKVCKLGVYEDEIGLGVLEDVCDVIVLEAVVDRLRG
jgi:hypothetical protein